LEGILLGRTTYVGLTLTLSSGTFGISTAYHLAKRGYTSITCIDRHPCPSLDSAAFDLNKIIRTEYDEPLYAELAIEALQAWRDPMWKDIFHETGWIVTTCGEPAAAEHLRRSYENLKRRGHADSIDFVQGKDQITQYVPQITAARGLDKWKGLWNRHAGWAHAKNALAKLGSEAERLGVRFVSGPEGTMTGLASEGNRITGVKVKSGAVLRASRYILATGAASPAILPELSPQLWSKCWTLAHIQLTKEEVEQFKGMPVVDNHELGFFFEPDPDSGWIKICNAFPGYQWRKGEYAHDGKVERYSVPRYASDHPEDGIPQEAVQAINRFIDAVVPQFSGRPLLGARICWCTDTPDQHWLIGPDPNYPRGELLLATGDSGHGFKFLPTIGQYIADAFEGRESGLRKEWQWSERKWHRDPTRPGDAVKDLNDVGFRTE
jgi:sarcosine oxidase/L-pipecolate oxidase